MFSLLLLLIKIPVFLGYILVLNDFIVKIALSLWYMYINGK